MKRKELLSPAGDMECLKWAIHAGCDAVYIGGKKFGARMYANNFDQKEIVEAIEYCHLYGVKIYVTVNTLFFEEEVEEVLEYITFLHQNGVDAVIMQDLGLICLVRKRLPNLEIHASTQMHNGSNQGLCLLKSLGIRRAVLARELSLLEINQFSCDIEKEIFIHGALCISYSGQCLFSSLVLGRSGNRGSCAGTCRLPYSLYQNDKKIISDKYLLSTKELNTIEEFRSIMDSDVVSLKIEGRMKSKYYVYFVTKIYRMLMDKYYQNKDMTVTEEEINQLKVLYNRGFTKGYLLGDTSKQLMNIDTPNHQGIPIGKVIGLTKDKIKILLSSNLSQGDGIRFVSSLEGMKVNYLYNKDGLLISKANIGDIIYLDKSFSVLENDTLVKTLDSSLHKEIESFLEKKIPVSIKVKAFIGKKIEIIMQDNDNNQISYIGKEVEPAQLHPIDKEDMVRQLSKLGNTCFIIDHISIEMDENIFFPLSNLNEMRRILVEKLIEKRKHPFRNILIQKEEILPFKKTICTKGISALVHTEEQLKALLPLENVSIYVENLAWYFTYKNTNKVYFRTNRALSNPQSYHQARLLVGDLGHFNQNKEDNDIVTDFYLNVTNSNTLEYFLSQGTSKVCLSLELEDNQIQTLVHSYYQRHRYYPNVEVLIYGKVELMMMKYCPLKMLVNKEKHCQVCKKKERYYLEDRNLKKYPIISRDCMNYILHYKKVNRLEKISSYQKMHVFHYQMIFYEESAEETYSLVQKVLSNLDKNTR